MAVNKSISKFLQPIAIATRTNNAMNQSELLAVTRNLLKAWEKSHDCTNCERSQPCISLVEKVAGDFKPITRGSDCNRVISFNSHWKAAASVKFY